jgi:hypothetical protein
MSIFSFFRRPGSSDLTPLEQEVLGALSAELPPAAREILAKQRDAINLVQRHAGGKEVNLYAMRRGRPCYEEHLLFPLQLEEAKLATLEIASSTGKTPLRAEVWLVKGWVFSIQFSKAPQEGLQAGARVLSVKVLRDPMMAVADVHQSPNPDELRTKLPDQYLGLVPEGHNVSIKDWVVYSLSNIRSVAQRDGNYYLVAEKVDMGAVALKEDDVSGQLYYLDYGDDHGERITVPLREFLDTFDGGKVEGRF